MQYVILAGIFTFVVFGWNLTSSWRGCQKPRSTLFFFFFVEKPSCLFGWTVSSSAFASEAGGVSWPMPACTHTELHLEMVLDFQPTYSSFLTSHSIRASLMYEYRDLRHLLRSPESVPLVSVRPHTSIYCHHQRKERRTNSDPKRAQP